MRVITVYAAVAFVILELVSIIVEPLKLPEWTLPFIIVLLCVGFIIAIILSWIYDIHPEGGIVKTEPAKEVSEESVPPSSKGWKIASYISFVVIVGLIVLNIVPRTGKKLILDKSIAVLPFENMSDENEFAHLGDAITDEIIMQLYKIHEFEVRSRTSIMQYKNTPKGSPVIGQELNVNYLLEGSAQRYEDKVRIRAQLIQASTDDHIWAEVFEGDWNNIFNIQINVAKQVAHELKTVLSPSEIERIEDEPTDNIEAYNLYLQGRHFWSQEGKDDLDKSIEYYIRALEIDPDYALAYTGMAITYTSYAWYGYSPRRDVIPQAKTAAKKALELDNKLGEAHTELAFARLIYDWDWSGSETGFKRALELNPNYARAHKQYAWVLSYVGRHDEALEQSKRAHELDPLSVDIWVEFGRRYYFDRDYDKAIDEYRKVIELFPNIKYSPISWYARSELAKALSQKGLHDEAIEEYLKADFEPTYHWHLGYIYGVAGKREKAQEILNYYLELSKKEFVWPASIGAIYIGLGEKDKAFEWLEKSYELREAWMIHLKVDPIFDSLRSDPRFQDLVDRMNFPDN